MKPDPAADLAALERRELEQYRLRLVADPRTAPALREAARAALVAPVVVLDEATREAESIAALNRLTEAESSVWAILCGIFDGDANPNVSNPAAWTERLAALDDLAADWLAQATGASEDLPRRWDEVRGAYRFYDTAVGRFVDRDRPWWAKPGATTAPPRSITPAAAPSPAPPPPAPTPTTAEGWRAYCAELAAKPRA